MGNYQDVASFESLTVTTISGNSGAVYANGHQQLTIHVKMVPLDKNGEYVQLSTSEVQKLISNVSLFNYDTHVLLSTADSYMADAQDSWAYAMKKGDFVQLPQSKDYQEISHSSSSNYEVTAELYLMCGLQEKGRKIKVGAEVILANGAAINTGSQGPFQSFVVATSLDPIPYSLSPDGTAAGGLLLIKTKKNFLSDDDFAYNYHVLIQHAAYPTAHMKFMSFKLWPWDNWNGDDEPEYPNYPDTNLKNSQLAFSFSYASSSYVNAGYIFDDIYGPLDFGSNITNKYFSPECVPNAFNLTCVHFKSKTNGVRDISGRLYCRFRDQYGNRGTFKIATISPSNNELWGSDLEFSNV